MAVIALATASLAIPELPRLNLRALLFFANLPAMLLRLAEGFRSPWYAVAIWSNCATHLTGGQ